MKTQQSLNRAGGFFNFVASMRNITVIIGDFQNAEHAAVNVKLASQRNLESSDGSGRARVCAAELVARLAVSAEASFL